MKYVLISIVAIVVGFTVACEFAFTQLPLSLVAGTGFIIGVCGTAIFPFAIAFWVAEKMNKGEKFLAYFSLFMVIIVTTSVISLFVKWFDYQEYLLNNNGRIVFSRVDNVEWESRKNSSLSGNYIYYTFEVDGETYEHSSKNDTLKVGDDIMIKYLPSNPDNHKIENSSTTTVK